MIGPLRFALTVMMSITSAGAPEQPAWFVAIDPKDVEFKIEAVGATPLPYQAVRLRATLSNVSAQRIGPVVPVDDIRDVYVQRPGHSSFREVEGALYILFKGRPTYVTALEAINSSALTRLVPGEETSATLPVAAQWRREGGGWLPADEVNPLFPSPGTFTLKLIYQHASEDKEYKRIEQSIQIQIPEPEGDDKTVYQQLRRDPELAHVLLSPVDTPDDKLLARIQALLKKHPKSSYTPYARFAVARHYARKGGPDYRIHRAVAATELAKIIRVDWPYQPNALLLMRQVAPLEAEDASKILRERYPDALEWLEVVAESSTPEEWRKLRKRQVPTK